MSTMKSHVALGFWSIPLLCSITAALSLPYIPTTILLPQTSSSRKDVAYAFIPSSESLSQHQLVSLNISTTLSNSNLSFETVTSNLPCFNQNTTTYAPSISRDGEISVYAGSCSNSTSTQLWRYIPAIPDTLEEGAWTRQTAGQDSGLIEASNIGIGYLARSLSFSTITNSNASDTDIYLFGGMCPEAEASASAWQSSATYSNGMLKISQSENKGFGVEIVTSRGPPIPEAGFTMTALVPSFSNGSGITTQQQSFVLFGGHTKTAFINTSQVAIWSLPEESWSFVTVDPPSTSNANTELAIKSTATAIDSRSGHTAVLSGDGGSIIIYGGWVGNIGQAADPQLAILYLGTGFGGDGDWRWVVPSEQPSGNGMYGHGAVMLPGNVMMVLGGHDITPVGISKRQGQSTTRAMFLNATSMQWISEYTNPEFVKSIDDDRHSGSSTNSNAKKVGLGAGLGLGFAAIVAAIIVFCWYSRRLKRRRASRDKEIRDLSAIGGNHFSTSGEMAQRSGSFPWTHGRWNNNDSETNTPAFDSNSAVAGYENLQSGVHSLGNAAVYPPPPKQIARKPLHSRNARGLYQPTSSYDVNPSSGHGRANSLGTAGPIHPIYEADEDQLSRKSNEGVVVTLDEHMSSAPKRYSDPFRDPHPNRLIIPHNNLRSGTPEVESPAQSREREIQEWVSDWAAADALLNSQARSHSNAGRLSPTRRAQLIAASTVSSLSAEEDCGRTASNLSDRSLAISTLTVSRSGSSSQSRSRNNSLRGFITNAISPFSAAVVSSTAPSTTFGPAYDGLKLPPLPRSAGSTNSSFTTANTSFAALQVEGEGLLPRPDDWTSNEHSPTRSEIDSPGSPSKSKNTGLGKGRGQSGWLGSLRRVFRSDTDDGNPYDFAPVPSRDPSPVRGGEGFGKSVEPRRTVSASATLWRRKQGKGDWQDSAALETRSNTFTGDLSAGNETRRIGSDARQDDDEEWDIERAVQNRVVQVMFTVPKEKLRVVNHNVADDLSDVGSLRSKQGSGKSLNLASDTFQSTAENPSTTGTRQEQLSNVDSETESPNSKGKGKSKVLAMVDIMERRSSPER